MKNTVKDLWKLVYEYSLTTLVLLEDSKDTRVGVWVTCLDHVSGSRVYVTCLCDSTSP